MSVKAVQWAIKVGGLKPFDKLILICLAEHCDHHGKAWPSRSRLADLAGCSMDTVDRSIKRLVQAGHVTRDTRLNGNGSYSASVYVVIGWEVAADSGCTGEISEYVEGSRSQRPGGHYERLEVAADSGQGSRTGAARTYNKNLSKIPPNPQRGNCDDVLEVSELRADPAPVPTSLPEVSREAPMPAHVKPVMDWRTAFGTDDDHAGIELQDGRLVLVNGTRSYWLDLFGGNEVDLDLALRQVRGWINSGSRKSLKAQVEAGLARIAQDRRQRSANYQEAARRNRVAGGNVVRGVF